MTRINDLRQRARTWWEVQPALLTRVLDEVQNAGFELTWEPTGSGVLTGQLPTWPLERPAPDGLDDLLGGVALTVEVAFGHAYPMVCPTVKPVDPEVPWDRRTQHKWHVNGNGSLCLLQSAQAWEPQTSLSDVLRKSAAWYVEYRLLEAGVIDAMSTSGIVSDDSYDHLVAAAVMRSELVDSEARGDGDAGDAGDGADPDGADPAGGEAA
jgi:hypothetical protein